MLLVVNAGSSSIKLALYDAALAPRAVASITEIGGKAQLAIEGRAAPCEAADHQAALAVGLATFAAQGIDMSALQAAGHRVVHGGRELTAPCHVTPDVMAALKACVPLAPLHNPHNITCIEALARLVPDLPQVACFDTAFHATNPEVALRYAIPAKEDAKGIRRYGFHGLSYESLVENFPGLTGTPLPERLLALHLGNGASLCAIRQGRSVATTMGYSPLDGLTMGTRAGGIDGNAVLRLAQDHGIEGAAHLLNRESGLLALGGASDMRALHRAGTEAAKFAKAHFSYWTIRNAGSMIAAMGGIDSLVFTGGIGENDHILREDIMAGLAWAGLKADAPANRQSARELSEIGSSVSAWIIPAAEERHIAALTQRCLARPGA